VASLPREVRRGRGIFSRVLLFGLAASLAPIAGLGYALLDLNTRALKQSTAELRVAVIEDVRGAIRAEMERTREELTGMGQLLLAPGLGDDDRRIALVGSKVTASEAFDHVTIYDAKGQLNGTIKALETPSPPAPQQLDAGTLEQAQTGRLVVREFRNDASNPLAEVVLAVRVDGVVRGHLATSLKLAALCRTLAELGERRLQSRDALYVVDEQRRLVLSADSARAASRRDESGRGIFSLKLGNPSFTNDFVTSIEEPYLEDGRKVVGSFETIHELGWNVVARQPRDLAFASLDQMRRSVALAFIVAAIAALLAAAYIARRLTRPIALLSTATRAIANRQFTGLPEQLMQRGDELGVLSRAFDGMAGDLAQSEANLVEETRVRSSLSRYLAPDVVDLIVKDPHRLRLSGERREVTVLFADVVAFTKLAEDRTPEEIVALLNELFTVATEIVQRRGGIVDKFIGDCVMAVWGAPEAHTDDPVRAVGAAEDLRRWLETANRRWRSKFGVEIRLGMGIHTGMVVAGTLGSEKRMEYTVIGDTVNVAARLESIAQPGQILLSEATKRRVEHAFDVRPAGERPLAGRTKSEQVYEVEE
jgi:adenylate cyclase